MSHSSIQQVGLSRNKEGVSKDQYYTNPILAKECINRFLETIRPNKEDILIEPSAGDGSFSDFLNDDWKLYSYDIEPKKEYIKEMDFLKMDVSMFEGKRVHCIGNPPFGKSGSLAKKFIKKCCKFSQSVSFILPKSFKKPSCYRVFPLNFHKVFEEDCPSKSFVVNGKEYDAQCVFQIWIRKDEVREEEPKLEPIGYSFVSKNKNPHIAITRVGGRSGKAYIDFQGKSEQTHLYIRLSDDVINNLNLDEFVGRLNDIKHNFNNTVGPRSIAKAELIPLINKELQSIIE
jgi:hypothetical protein